MTNPKIAPFISPDAKNPNYAGLSAEARKHLKHGNFSWAPTVKYPVAGGTVSREELALLIRDSKYFREHFFWIIDKDGKKVPYRQNWAQNEFYMHRTSHDLVLKSRKMGTSSEIEGDFLFDCMTLPNQTCVTMAHREDDMKVHLQRINFYLQTCGAAGFEFKVEVGKSNSTEIFFPTTNSYYWIGTAGAKGWGRGRTINKFHGSEVSHYEDQSVLTGVLEAVPDSPNSRRVLETTANGTGERFHELWEEASDPASGSPWAAKFYAWWQDPDYAVAGYEIPYNFSPTTYEQSLIDQFKLKPEQLMWYRRKVASMVDKSLAPQEYPATPTESFISSGRPVFPPDKVDLMLSRARDPLWQGDIVDDAARVNFRPDPDGLLSIWLQPRPIAKYLISADIALGVRGGAFSVATVFDRATHEVVAEWRGRIDPNKFGDILVNLAMYYGYALLAPENNNMGRVTIQRIVDRNYPHIVNCEDFWPGLNKEYGIPTNERTKTQFISALRNALDDLTYVDNSRVALMEIKTAVYNESGKMVSNRDRITDTNEKGAHLDCVITRGIGLFLLNHLTKDETYRIMNGNDGVIVSRISTGSPRYAK